MNKKPITWFNLNKSSEKYSKYSEKKETTYVITPDLFVIDTSDNFIIVFSPLLARVYYIPKKFITEINPLSFNKDNIDELIKANILLPKKIAASLAPTKPDCKTFNPNIRLLMTTSCNLNCVYCYADANKTTQLLDISKLETLLNAVPEGTKSLNIEFHGGEPTIAFNKMKEAYRLIISKFPDSTFMIQTNGVFKANVMDWLIEHNITINFSIDGTEKTHNKQRPAINSQTNSFKILINNIKEAQANNTGKACIVTITNYNLDMMHEIYLFLKDNGFKYIKFNPLLEEGRAKKYDNAETTPPNLQEFAKNMASIMLEAFQNKIMIDSDLLPNIHVRQPSYSRCGAVCGQMTLCPNGDIIACADAYYLTEDKKDNPFFFAEVKDSISYNKEHLATLNKTTMDNYPVCNDCFLKWHCAGGCKIENYLANKDILKPDNNSCAAKKTLIKEYFKQIGKEIL